VRNLTPEGRAMNQRVEIFVAEYDTYPAEEKTERGEKPSSDYLIFSYKVIM
jgi:hypothetical protein